MNKYIMALSFTILILSGFLFSYVLSQTGLIWQTYWLLITFYLSLFYIMIQFIQKPNVELKQSPKTRNKMKQKRFKKVVIWDFEPINQDLSINIDHIVKLFVYPLFLIFYGLVGIFYLIFYPFYIGLALLLCLINK